MGGKWFIDHLAFEIDCCDATRRCVVVGSEQASRSVDVGIARDERRVGNGDLGRVDTELACVAEIASLLGFDPIPSIVAEVGDDLIDHRNAGEASGEHDAGSCVVHLVVGLGSNAAHVGDVVLRTEVRTDHPWVCQEPASVGDAECRFEPGEDPEMIETSAAESCRGNVEVCQLVDLRDDNRSSLGSDTPGDVIIEPLRCNGIHPNDHRAAGAHQVGHRRTCDGASLGLRIRRDRILTVDEEKIGTSAGQLGQEVRANGRSNEHRSHPRHRCEWVRHGTIVSDRGHRHEYGSAMMQEPKSQDAGIALVTGASSGIGAATVRVLAEAGWRVVATARRSDRLEALAADTGCVPVTLDVTQGDAVRRVGLSEPFDLIVNNAGLGRAMGAIWEASDSDVERTIDTNVMGVVNVIRAVVPGMIERGRGHIVNMSSVLALYPGPAALYGATKGAVRLLSQDLRQELRGTGIRVTEICPGRVATEFYDVALDDPNAAATAKDSGIHDVTPADVAHAVLYAVSAPWRVNVSTIEIVPTEQTYGGAQFTPVSL